MPKKIKLTNIILLLILLLGFSVRVYQVSVIPPGFFADEASIGYNAYTLINNFSDETGNKSPVFFKNFGSFYRPGLSIYLTSPFIFLFGLNEFSSRFSSAVFGTLTILIVYYLTIYLFKNYKIALLSSLFLAISPWHIHFSRINQEFAYLAFSLSFSLLIFLLGIHKRKKLIPLSFVLFGLSLYSYVTAYVIIPLFLVSLCTIYYKKIKINKKFFLIGFILLSIISLPLILGLSNGKTMSRFNQISTANEMKTKQEIFKGVINTYKGHFSSDFLFTKGDIDYKEHFITRFSVRGIGQLYLFQLPFIILGFIYSYRYKKTFLLLLAWLIIFPLGSTFAPFADGGGPFASRSITGVIPFQIFTAAGIFYLLSLAKRKIVKKSLILLIFISIILSFYRFLFLYFSEYPKYSSNFWGWQYGAREIVNYFEEHENEYDHLYMAPEFNAPDIFLKFYSPQNCHKCAVGLPKDFMNQKGKTLFAVTPAYLSQNSDINFLTIKEVKYPKGGVAFKIGTIVK